jgi:hypothetical protein
MPCLKGGDANPREAGDHLPTGRGTIGSRDRIAGAWPLTSIEVVERALGIL